MGELDPQTGLFYTTASSTTTVPVTSEVSIAEPRVETVVVSRPSRSLVVNDNVIRVSKENPVTTVRTPESVTATEFVDSTLKADLEPKQLDFLSSALNQAQIDLDPYQFIEEDEPAPFPTKLPHQHQHVTVNEAVSSENQGPLVSILSPQPSLANPVTYSSLSSTTVSRESQSTGKDFKFEMCSKFRLILPETEIVSIHCNMYYLCVFC